MYHSKPTATLLLILILLSLAVTSINIKSSLASNETEEDNAPEFRLEPKPAVRRCKAGDIIKFNIEIKKNEDEAPKGHKRGELVFLRVEGLPLEWISQLSPRIGRTDFKSKLTIRTTTESPQGTYNITVVGVGFGGSKSHTVVSVIVEQTDGKADSKEPYKPEAQLTIRTYRAVYRTGEEVELIGSLSTNFGLPITNATIYLFVINPAGRLIHFNSTRTDKLGTFYDSFKLTGEEDIKPLNGTYITYATAMYGERILRTHTTFIVEYPSYPSVQIDSILTLNSVGNETKSIYRQGEAMKIKVTVTNYGMALNSSVVWVELQAPNRIPIKVMLTIVPMSSGESKVLIFDFKVPSNAEPGIYYVSVFVSDRPISSGGKFITMESETFIVENS